MCKRRIIFLVKFVTWLFARVVRMVFLLFHSVLRIDYKRVGGRRNKNYGILKIRNHLAFGGGGKEGVKNYLSTCGKNNYSIIGQQK